MDRRLSRAIHHDKSGRPRRTAVHLRRVAPVPARQDCQRRRREGLSRPAEDAVLDNAVSTETPEGIVFELRPAGLAVRYCAFMLDWLIRLVIMAVAAAVAGILGGIGVAFWLVLLFVLEWFYPVFFELSA